jgi:Domain of unknown function (DUF4159)
MNIRILLAALLLPFGTAPAQDTLVNPAWTNPSQFAREGFAFVRLRPENHGEWSTDYPDSDLNLPYRLHDLTSLSVDTHSRILDITSPELAGYPFCYIVEPGVLSLTQKEAEILRRYLLNGGFLMFDDFWGEDEWQVLYRNLKLIFPDREPVELQLDHPVFHTVFDLKEKPQIPSINVARANRATGEFYESGAKGSHFYGIFDDKGRMMIFISRDNDLGDSWEREGDDPWYFHEFSEKRGYPLTINIIMYLLTH